MDLFISNRLGFIFNFETYFLVNMPIHFSVIKVHYSDIAVI